MCNCLLHPILVFEPHSASGAPASGPCIRRFLPHRLRQRLFWCALQEIRTDRSGPPENPPTGASAPRRPEAGRQFAGRRPHRARAGLTGGPCGPEWAVATDPGLRDSLTGSVANEWRTARPRTHLRTSRRRAEGRLSAGLLSAASDVRGPASQRRLVRGGTRRRLVT